MKKGALNIFISNSFLFRIITESYFLDHFRFFDIIFVVYGFIWHVQEISFLLWDLLKRLFSPPFYGREFIEEMDNLGVSSLPITILTGLFLGLVLTLQAAIGVQKLGAVSLVPKAITVTLVREIGPVVGSLMIAGRVGAGITSQVGSMKVTYQLDAMRALGTDPLRRLILPKFLAITVMLPILILLLCFVGLASAFLMASMDLNIGGVYFWNQVISSISFIDLLNTLTKSFVFGAIIGLFGNYFGLQSRGGTEGVGVATTRAVIVIFVSILAADFVLTKIFYEILT